MANTPNPFTAENRLLGPPALPPKAKKAASPNLPRATKLPPANRPVVKTDPRVAENRLLGPPAFQQKPVATKPVKNYGPPAPKNIKQVDAAQHVRNMQQFLKNRGYDITVDGIRGAQTNAVVAAFHKGIKPGQMGGQKAAQSAAASAGVKAPSVPGGGGGGGSVPKASPLPKPGVPAQQPQGGSPSTDPFSVDPYAYAKAAANSQYDPQINSLQGQLNQLDPQHAQNIADLTSWINQIRGDNNKAMQGTDAFDQKNLAGYDQSAQAIASLFGQQNAPDFSGYANIGRAELTGLGDNQHAFQQNLGTILAAQGADNLRAEGGAYQKNKSDLLGQLGAARTAKGQGYIADLQTGMDNAQKAAIAKQSLALAQGTQPYQIQTARAQAQAARAQAAAAKAEASNSGATAKANLALINARVTQAQAAAKASGGTWNLQNPNDRGSLAQAIRTSIGNKQGWLRVSPQIAMNNIQQALNQAGLGSDPDAQALAQSVFQEVLNNSHSAKLWRNVTYENGKLTVKKSKKK